MEKISELIRNGKLRLCQLARIDLAEIIVSLNNDEMDKLWEESEPEQMVCGNILGEINNFPKK